MLETENPKEIVSFESTTTPAEPWLEAGELPYGYSINKRGVFRQTENKQGDIKDESICGPLWVSARTRGTDANNHGLLLKWLDSDQTQHEKVIRRGRLHDQSSTLIVELANEGLKVQPGKEALVKTYLSNCEPEQVLQSVELLGWNRVDTGNVYVRPIEVIARGTDHRRVIFQPAQPCSTVSTMTGEGTIESYGADVIGRILEQPYLLFCFFASLSASLMKTAEQETGAFHFFGASTGGKTTALQIAASVWGIGGDPQRDDQTFCRSWNATANGLEGIAAAHNDSVLALDELGKFQGDNFASTIYNLAGSKSKERMAADCSQQKNTSWRLLCLSTGEISIEERVKEDGKTLKDGMKVRFVDIPVGDSMITGLSQQEARDLSDTLKNAVSARAYGVVGPAFVKGLLERFPDDASMSEEVKDMVLAAEGAIAKKISLNLPPTAMRVLKRFALVLATARYAQEMFDLALDDEALIEVVMSVVRLWLGDGQALKTEDDLLSDKFAEFLEANECNFTDGNPIGEAAKPPQHCIGYKLDGRLYLTEKGLKEACQGRNASTAARVLYKKGAIEKTEADRYTTKKTVGGARITVYLISENFLREVRR